VVVVVVKMVVVVVVVVGGMVVVGGVVVEVGGGVGGGGGGEGGEGRGRLRMFENRVLRKMFGTKRKEVQGTGRDWKHNEQLHGL